MFQFEVDLQEDVYAFQPGAFSQIETNMQQYLDSDVVTFIQQEVDKRLGIAPGPVFYPIEWANPIPPPSGKHANLPGGLWSKQKAAFFGTNGFGHGIPTRRTGALLHNWNILHGGNTIIITNTSPYAQFVVGASQQKFHANTGWPKAEDILFDILVDVDLINLIADGWQRAVNGDL